MVLTRHCDCRPRGLPRLHYSRPHTNISNTKFQLNSQMLVCGLYKRGHCLLGPSGCFQHPLDRGDRRILSNKGTRPLLKNASKKTETSVVQLSTVPSVPLLSGDAAPLESREPNARRTSRSRQAKHGATRRSDRGALGEANEQALRHRPVLSEEECTHDRSIAWEKGRAQTAFPSRQAPIG